MKALFFITVVTMMLTGLFLVYMVEHVKSVELFHFITLSMLSMAVIIGLKTLKNKLSI